MATIKHYEIDKETGFEIEFHVNIESNLYKSYIKGTSKLHSCNDKPAAVHPNGDKTWYKNDKLHRDNDEPAIIRLNGTKWWLKNGELHRNNDKPASVYSNGTMEWFKDGQFIKREVP